MANTITTDDIYMKNPGITTSTAIQGKDASEMGMDDFFNLLVAQMTNQDMLNPQGDTEFIAQMAQFSSLKGIQQIQEYQLSSYAVSYVGKNVTVAQINETTGKIERFSGVVKSISFYDGAPKVIIEVNGKDKAFDLHTVMEINANAADSGSTVVNPITEASKFIGKFVSIKVTDEDGNETEVNGLVESVTSKDGKGYVFVDGKSYPSSDIMSYKDPADYVGKQVLIRTTDEYGDPDEINGIVQKIEIKNGKAYVYVDGKPYLMTEVITSEDPPKE